MSDLQTKSTTHTSEDSSPLCNNVIERLANEDITPRPWWQFYMHEGAVWCGWLLSVLVGAAAVAVTLYVAVSVPGMLYEATHTNLLTAMVHALPWLWLTVFLAMAYLAWMHLRHTRRGYRYQALTLVTSSVVLSIGLGVLLQQFGQGYVLDRTFAAWADMYPSYEKAQLTVWQAPESGRLVGAVIPEDGQILIDHATGTVVFKDTNGQQWRLSLAELSARDQRLLENDSGARLRLLGTSTAPQEFHVCGAFNWVYKPNYQAYRHAQNVERGSFRETAAYHQKAVTTGHQTPCAALPAFKRVGSTP